MTDKEKEEVIQEVTSRVLTAIKNGLESQENVTKTDTKKQANVTLPPEVAPPPPVKLENTEKPKSDHPDPEGYPNSNNPDRIAVIIYHKNIYDIYNISWIQECLLSLTSQTVKNYTVFELNYGADDTQLWKPREGVEHYFYNQEMNNHAEAMNFLLDEAFKSHEIVFNTNLDDTYHPKRIERQLAYLKMGSEIVSSNFQLVKDGSRTLVQEMHKKNLQAELAEDHNIICHPVIAMTKEFWEKNKYYDTGYSYEKRIEDMQLWKKALANGSKFSIVPEVLCFYRVHDQQTGKGKN